MKKSFILLIALAKMDGRKTALRTWLDAQKAEAEHEKLEQYALDNPGRNSGSPL